MCFSEQASFSTAALLALAGLASFGVVRKEPKLYPAALVPFCFAIQQSAEGFQWLYLKGIFGTPHLSIMAKYVFLFFAYCFWPAWLPLAVYFPEKEPIKKRILLAFTLAGFAFSFYTGWQIFTGHTSVEAIQNSIYYSTPVHERMLSPYLFFVITPWFISSYPKMALVGSVYALSCAIAGYVYTNAFTSVWCFFAAVISIFLIFALRDIYGKMHPSSETP